MKPVRTAGFLVAGGALAYLLMTPEAGFNLKQYLPGEKSGPAPVEEEAPDAETAPDIYAETAVVIIRGETIFRGDEEILAQDACDWASEKGVQLTVYRADDARVAPEEEIKAACSLVVFYDLADIQRAE